MSNPVWSQMCLDMSNIMMSVNPEMHEEIICKWKSHVLSLSDWQKKRKQLHLPLVNVCDNVKSCRSPSLAPRVHTNLSSALFLTCVILWMHELLSQLEEHGSGLIDWLCLARLHALKNWCFVFVVNFPVFTLHTCTHIQYCIHTLGSWRPLEKFPLCMFLS